MADKGMRAYEELCDITLPTEQEKMMDIICDAWEECRQQDHCANCPDRPRKNMRLMACTALKYTRLLCEADYIKLPCKIGDKVWAIRNFSGRTQAVEGKVSEMYFIEEMRLTIVVKNVARGQWGVKIFATREECEQAIKEKESKKV